jgi:SAM-dependent methyltransferase
MANYRELEQFYRDSPEELRLQKDGAQYLEYLTAMRYLTRYLPAGCSVLDHCAGTGAYSFALAERGFRVTAGDIVGQNVDFIRERQKKSPVLEDVFQGDALDLSRFPDNSFDAALLMGALYHLKEAGERRRAVGEGMRVLRAGGVLACTYMNRYGVILCDSEGALENLGDILRFAGSGEEGVFYASTPEEMAGLAGSRGLEILCHVALDGMANFLHRTAGLLNGEGFLRWQEYHAATCEVPSLLGASYHNMMICRKQA